MDKKELQVSAKVHGNQFLKRATVTKFKSIVAGIDIYRNVFTTEIASYKFPVSNDGQEVNETCRKQLESGLRRNRPLGAFVLAAPILPIYFRATMFNKKTLKPWDLKEIFTADIIHTSIHLKNIFLINEATNDIAKFERSDPQNFIDHFRCS